MTEQTYETFFENEEFITAEEYLRRRAIAYSLSRRKTGGAM
jgi:hypothetical protein